MLTAAQITEKIKEYATCAGFDLCGFVTLEEKRRELEYFAEWIEQGRAGEMEYLKARNEEGRLKRSAVRNFAPWARSVIVCAINYNTDLPCSTEMLDKSRAWISRYAWFADEAGKNADYHDALLERLREVEAALQRDAQDITGQQLQTRCYVDTGPLIERVYAKYAGIGWIGKNTCVINQGMGSWLFLGSILTSIELPKEDAKAPCAEIAADRCGSCTRCLDACPTSALTAPYQMDATRCISYLTIEKRGAIPEELRGLMGNNVFGCDICQDVCPWNGRAGMSAGVADNVPGKPPVARAVELEPRKELFAPALKTLGEMDREAFNKTFRGSPIKRAKYEGLRRNVAIAMGNSGDKKFIRPLEHMAADEDRILSEHARWALQKLKSKQTT